MANFSQDNFEVYLNMSVVEWYVCQYHHLDIQRIVIFLNGILFIDSQGRWNSQMKVSIVVLSSSLDKHKQYIYLTKFICGEFRTLKNKRSEFRNSTVIIIHIILEKQRRRHYSKLFAEILQ